VPREVGCVSDHAQEVGAALVLVLPGPGQVHQLAGLDGPIVLELDQRQLAGNLNRVVGQNLRPVILIKEAK
jgi:hypothetical protein